MVPKSGGGPMFYGGPRNSPTLAELVDELAEKSFDEEGEKEAEEPEELTF